MFISILFIARDMTLTRFEKARIIGARGLQIALGAPVLIKVPDNLVDPIEIARLEFKQGLIPISVVK
jgi:DNA-directed RNA polymerase subunit K